MRFVHVVQIPDVTRDYLLEVEEAAKHRKQLRQSDLWDDKMKATQTQSACGIQVT